MFSFKFYDSIPLCDIIVFSFYIMYYREYHLYLYCLQNLMTSKLHFKTSCNIVSSFMKGSTIKKMFYVIMNSLRVSFVEVNVL